MNSIKRLPRRRAAGRKAVCSWDVHEVRGVWNCMIGLHGATTRNPVCLPVCPVNRTRRVAGWVGGPDHPWCMADLFVVLLRILADIDTESLSI